MAMPLLQTSPSWYPRLIRGSRGALIMHHRSLGIILLATCATLGCSSPSTAVRADLTAYLRLMATWGGIEAETARTLERILKTEFVDEAEVMHQIADSRPRIAAHLERIRADTPRTDPVRRIHAAYVATWERLLTGYDAIEKGFSTAEYGNLAHGREAMAAWRDGLVQVARDLRELAQRVGVDPGALQETSSGPDVRASSQSAKARLRA
jgi:hypothetical protein